MQEIIDTLVKEYGYIRCIAEDLVAGKDTSNDTAADAARKIAYADVVQRM